MPCLSAVVACQAARLGRIAAKGLSAAATGLFSRPLGVKPYSVSKIRNWAVLLGPKATGSLWNPANKVASKPKAGRSPGSSAKPAADCSSCQAKRAGSDSQAGGLTVAGKASKAGFFFKVWVSITNLGGHTFKPFNEKFRLSRYRGRVGQVAGQESLPLFRDSLPFPYPFFFRFSLATD